MRNAIEFDEIDEHGPQEYHGTFEIPLSDLDRDELSAIGPVSIEARAEQGGADGDYLIDGSVRFTADFNCSRCLDPYPIANQSAFHIRFRPRPTVTGENEEVEITEAEELDVEFYAERAVPLRDLAVEQVQLAIPMKPLCSESCLGLCSNCGVNRNRESCSCEKSAVDERWGALHDIREQLTKKNDN